MKPWDENKRKRAVNCLNDVVEMSRAQRDELSEDWVAEEGLNEQERTAIVDDIKVSIAILRIAQEALEV